MRDASDLLPEVLASSLSVRLVADVFYDDERTFVNLPVTDWNFSWDAESAIKFAGTLTVVYQGDRGDSLAPKTFTDPLAPFGQEIAVLAKVSFGTIFTETILLGRFRIKKAPSAVEQWFGFNGRPAVSGSVVQLTLVDRLDAVNTAAFRWPGVPTYTSSTWDELQYISGLPLDVNLPDLPTPGDLVYQPGPGGRLTAVQQLMSYLGGVAVTNSDGELTALPYTAGAPTLTLSMGTEGTVIDIDGSLDSTELFNEVVGVYQDDDGNPIFAAAWISAGPLATDGPYGPNTAPNDADDSVKTQNQANARVKQVLQQYLAAQTIRYTITCLFDPRAEQGDVVRVNGPVAHAVTVSTATSDILTAAGDGTASGVFADNGDGTATLAATANDDGTAATAAGTVTRTAGAASDPAWTLLGRLISIDWASGTEGQMTVVLDVGAAIQGVRISVGST